jgi:pimeloyl-ACP methyl ester carboxylesterase
MPRIPLALVPGTLCDARLFAPQMAALADVAVPHPIDTTPHDTLAGVAHDILNALPDRFALAGLSYGGIVAFEVWRQAPERVAGLALLNTTHLPVSDESRRAQQQFVGMATLGEFREITRDYLKDRMLHPQHRLNDDLRATVMQMAESVGKYGFINQVKAQLPRPDSTPTLATITAPTLVLTGRQDAVCPPVLHQAMADAIPNAQLAIVENCGHLSTLEQPDVVNAHLRTWLAQL